jgi:hypothetical protein
MCSNSKCLSVEMWYLIPVNDSRTIHLEERGNDMIRAKKKQLVLNFDVKCATVQFHDNNHNYQSDCWIRLKVYVESPNMLSYLGLTLQVNQSSEGITILVNRGCTNFVIYFLLTWRFSIWLGFFFYKDMAAGFENFMVL